MKYKNLVLVAILIIATVVVTSTSAYMRKETATVSNEFKPAIVDCVVEETFTDNVKTSIKVQNTSDVSAYIRLRVVSYWVDANGVIQHMNSSSVGIEYDNAKWIKDSTNDTYYYTETVDVNEKVELLENDKSVSVATNNGFYQVIDVFAEAIQADPTSAVEQAWPVTLTGDQITAIKQ